MAKLGNSENLGNREKTADTNPLFSLAQSMGRIAKLYGDGVDLKPFVEFLEELGSSGCNEDNPANLDLRTEEEIAEGKSCIRRDLTYEIINELFGEGVIPEEIDMSLVRKKYNYADSYIAQYIKGRIKSVNPLDEITSIKESESKESFVFEVESKRFPGVVISVIIEKRIDGEYPKFERIDFYTKEDVDRSEIDIDSLTDEFSEVLGIR